MIDRSKIRVSRLALGLLAALAAAPAFAQSTSASLGGRVVADDGQPVANAEVVIVHAPSGTVSRTTTDASGRYVSRGLRVGGPYTVTVQAPGFQSTAQEDIYAQLAETSTVNIALATDAATTLDAVTVVGTRVSDIFGSDRIGTGTNVSRDQIESLPSVGRNIQDYIRLDPRIAQTSKGRGEISAGGQNTRFNAIRIDGISSSDTFGLEANNSPTLRQPVSIDAIEEVNIALADYDVVIAGATGAVVNAVTRSGTNEFSGSVYGTYIDQDWVRGNDSAGGIYQPFDGGTFNGFIDEQTFGATLGGPLAKDRLFFFLNYENFTRRAPGATVSSAASAITDADISNVQRIARDVYGFDAGSSLTPDNLETTLEEYAAKIDWNISDNHRASFRYSKIEQSDTFLYGFGSAARSLSSSWSVTDKVVESVVAQLYSDWSTNFSTEFKISQRDYEAVRNPFSRLPNVGIAFGTPNPNTGAPSSPFLNLGTDRFSHFNVLETDTFNVFGAGTYFAGDHEIKFGFDYEDNGIYNLFGQDQFGAYTFRSVEDFENGAYWSYASKAPRPGQPVDSIAADYSQKNLGFFIQDTWAATYNLTLTAGLRYDRVSLSDAPEYNALVDTVFGYDNRFTPDGSSLLQPRLGFNYTFDSDRPTQLRGGAGLFQGAAANVWIGNSFANTGLNVVDYGINFGAADLRDLTEAEREAIRAQFPFTPDPDNQPQPSLGQQQAVNIMDPDFQQPSVWKANLALDHELPWYGVVASAEVLLTQVKHGLHYERLDLGAPTAVGPDGRLIYWSNPAQGSGSRANQNTRLNELRAAGQLPAGFDNVTGWAGDGVILLSNTDKGSSQQMTVSLNKPMEHNWSWLAAYTYTRADEVNPLTSSRAISNWNGRMVFQPNEDITGTSNYEIKDRFTGILSYRNFFFGQNKTEFSLFYEGRSGKPYSWGFSNDANGDGINNNDLFYVPAGRGDVAFTGGAAMEDRFFEWLATQPDLARYAGQVAPRNSSRSRFVNTFDLRISQELPGFFRDNKAEVWLDLINVGNLINKDWGQVQEVGFPLNRRVAEFRGINADGQYVYNFNPDASNFGREDLYDNQDQTKGVSRWQVQLGFRYRF